MNGLTGELAVELAKLETLHEFVLALMEELATLDVWECQVKQDYVTLEYVLHTSQNQTTPSGAFCVLLRDKFHVQNF